MASYHRKYPPRSGLEAKLSTYLALLEQVRATAAALREAGLETTPDSRLATTIARVRRAHQAIASARSQEQYEDRAERLDDAIGLGLLGPYDGWDELELRGPAIRLFDALAAKAEDLRRYANATWERD